MKLLYVCVIVCLWGRILSIPILENSEGDPYSDEELSPEELEFLDLILKNYYNQMAGTFEENKDVDHLAHLKELVEQLIDYYTPVEDTEGDRREMVADDIGQQSYLDRRVVADSNNYFDQRYLKNIGTSKRYLDNLGSNLLSGGSLPSKRYLDSIGRHSAMPSKRYLELIGSSEPLAKRYQDGTRRSALDKRYYLENIGSDSPLVAKRYLEHLGSLSPLVAKRYLESIGTESPLIAKRYLESLGSKSPLIAKRYLERIGLSSPIAAKRGNSGVFKDHYSVPKRYLDEIGSNSLVDKRMQDDANMKLSEKKNVEASATPTEATEDINIENDQKLIELVSKLMEKDKTKGETH